MQFTQEKLEELEAAYQALITGEKEVSLTMGDKSVTYTKGNVRHLVALIAQGQAQLNPQPQNILIRTSKGL